MAQQEQKTPAPKAGLGKFGKIGAIVAAVIGAVLVNGPAKNFGLIPEFGIFFVLATAGILIGGAVDSALAKPAATEK